MSVFFLTREGNTLVDSIRKPSPELGNWVLNDERFPGPAHFLALALKEGGITTPTDLGVVRVGTWFLGLSKLQSLAGGVPSRRGSV
jgi:hypothetical protein